VNVSITLFLSFYFDVIIFQYFQVTFHKQSLSAKRCARASRNVKMFGSLIARRSKIVSNKGVFKEKNILVYIKIIFKYFISC